MCRSHDPEIESDRWFSRGAALLAEVYQKQRAGRWPTNPEFKFWDEPMPVEWNGYETHSPLIWLGQHPRCDVALRSEYGDTRELAEARPDASQV